MQHFWERFAIVLDVVAFFLVTVDLYGEDRLTLLRRKIKQIKSPQLLEVFGKSGTISNKVQFAKVASANINHWKDISEEAKKLAEMLYDFITTNN